MSIKLSATIYFYSFITANAIFDFFFSVKGRCAVPINYNLD